MSIIIKSSGKWSIRQVEIPCKEEDCRSCGFEDSPPGVYDLLYHNDRKTVMSNSLMEIEDQEEFLSIAVGNVLIGGLGLGIIVSRLLNKGGIDSIVVIESEQGVIDLIAPKFSNCPKVSIILGNVKNFEPQQLTKSPDCVYLDIWDKADSRSYQDRISVLNHWSQYCDCCYAWALEKSQKLFKGIKNA